MAFTGGNERFHRGLPCLVSAAIRGASPQCSRVLFARVLPLRRELNHLVQLLPSTSLPCVVVLTTAQYSHVKSRRYDRTTAYPLKYVWPGHDCMQVSR
jgi:hypothetical protein